MKKIASILLFAFSLLVSHRDNGQEANDTLHRRTRASWIVGDSTPIAVMGFCYSADSNFTSWQNRPAGAIDCGASLPEYKAGTKGSKSLSIQTMDTSTCIYKFSLGDAEDQVGEYQQAVNELKWYIETCYDTGESWQAFGDLTDAVGGISSDTARFTAYREWLKSVLWLNTIDPLYYCTCAEAIFGTYYNLNWNAMISVIRYLDSSNRCPVDTMDNNNDYRQALSMRHQKWLDTVNSLHHGDTIDFPEDTTIPTIDELGLSILRGPPAGVQSDTTTTGISNLTASENPFQKSTTISFTTGEYSYISFQVFDVLGKVVIGDYKGTVLTPGTYSFNIDGTNLVDGTYYARITTPLGETRMIKLVKE